MTTGASCFFFSSRRRHTRLQGDWSSDVCSSDLCRLLSCPRRSAPWSCWSNCVPGPGAWCLWWRSEEHTSELQSPCNLVCRLLLEKKKTAAITLSPRSSRTSLPHLSNSAAHDCAYLMVLHSSAEQR